MQLQFLFFSFIIRINDKIEYKIVYFVYHIIKLIEYFIKQFFSTFSNSECDDKSKRTTSGKF